MPKLIDHDLRRADLARAAWVAIADAGIDRVTLRQVAAAAGCTTGTLTHYFQDKDELLVAALDQAARATMERISRRAEAEPADLRGVLAESLPLDDQRHLEWRIWLCFWGRAVADERLRAEQHARYRAWHDLLGGFLASLVQQQRLSADLDPERTADQLITVTDGIGIRATLDGAAWPPARQLEHLDLHVDQLVPPANDADPGRPVRRGRGNRRS